MKVRHSKIELFQSNFNYLIILFFTMFSIQLFAIENEIVGSGLTEENLLYFVQQGFTPTTVPSYDNSRDIIFSSLDNTNNFVSGVYSGYSIDMVGGYCNCNNGNSNCEETNNISTCVNNSGEWVDENDPSVEAYYKGMNVEHTWPRSKGAEFGNPKSDLHHLFPTKDNINSSRGNDPFADIPDNDTHKWYRNSEILLEIPQSNINEYAEKFNPPNQPNSERFEPKEAHKGNVARAMFYFYSIYEDSAHVDFWNIQKSILLDWHYSDPVDDSEYERTEEIALYQHNLKNPFVMDSTLARRIWYYQENITNTQVSFDVSQITINESNSTIPVQINIQNPSPNQNTQVLLNIGDGSLNEDEYSISTNEFFFNIGSIQNQTFLIWLTDDEIYEGQEKLIIEIAQVIGGDSVIIGNPSIFTLNVNDNDLPKVIITEVMINPQATSDSNGEWFEIFINNEIPVNFKNWMIKDKDTDDFLILDNIEISNGDYAVFGNNSNFNSNGGVDIIAEYSGINLANAGDELILISPEGFIADSISWDGGNQFPFSNGSSMGLTDLNLDNLIASNWQESNLIFGSGDSGTPGFENCFYPNELDECGICGGNGNSCNSLLGDVNFDNLINVVDIVQIVGFILETESPNPDQFFSADINQDLAINVVDVVIIVGIILGD
jgi:endonuclease I